MNDTDDLCYCNNGFTDKETFATGLSICNKTCESVSSTYVSRPNDCDCNSGYETLYLSSDLTEFYCEALCDTYSSYLETDDNACYCNDGFTTLTTNTASNTQWCEIVCETDSSTKNDT